MSTDPDGRTPAVLVVEDDRVIARRLSEYLEGRGMTASAVHTLGSARVLLRRHTFDAVVLDLNLAGEDGLVLARELAGGGPPVVIASSRGDEADRVLGLELGADDYLVKPFSFREMLARLKAVIRRAEGSRRRPAVRRVARFGMWALDVTARRLVHDSGREVSLTDGEMTLLAVFVEHPDRLFLRTQLIALTHVSDAAVFDRAIDVMVGRLRRKLAPDSTKPPLIRTVRAQGYRFTAPVTWSETPD